MMMRLMREENQFLVCLPARRSPHLIRTSKTELFDDFQMGNVFK